jgi:preprotein translocase subunit SecG
MSDLAVPKGSLAKLQAQYDVVLAQYKQVTMDYVNAKNNTNFDSLPGTSFWGKSELETLPSINTSDDCIVACQGNPACTGATYDSDKKMCWLRQGEGLIAVAPGTQVMSLLPHSRNLLIQRKSLNQQLMDIIIQMQEFKKANPTELTDNTATIEQTNSELEVLYAALLVEQDRMRDILSNTDALSVSQQSSGQFVHRYYQIFMVIFLFASIVVTFFYSKMEMQEYMYVLCGLLIAALILLFHYRIIMNSTT